MTVSLGPARPADPAEALELLKGFAAWVYDKPSSTRDSVLRSLAVRARTLLAGAAAPAGDTAPAETREEWLVRWTWSDGTTEEDRPREDRQMAERQIRIMLRPPTAVASAKLYRRTVSPWVAVPGPADPTNTEV